jgi:chemotaxis protein MotB
MAKAPAPANDVRPIVIRRIKKGGHGGHHGGAWKVAYADFVTAMMAFFMLLCLLANPDKQQLRGLAE